MLWRRKIKNTVLNLREYIELRRTVLLFNEEEIEKITVFKIRVYIYIELRRSVLLFNEEENEKITVFKIRVYIIYRTKKNCSFI